MEKRRTPAREVLKAFGETIRRLRHAKGWSQERFAEECGLDRTYVGGIERGERNPSALNIKKIADSLGVGIVRLFRGL